MMNAIFEGQKWTCLTSSEWEKLTADINRANAALQQCRDALVFAEVLLTLREDMQAAPELFHAVCQTYLRRIRDLLKGAAMTDQFTEIKARRAKITPGEWRVVTDSRVPGEYHIENGSDRPIAGYLEEADAAFIAHAPDDMDCLLSEIERLRLESASRQQAAHYWKRRADRSRQEGFEEGYALALAAPGDTP